ncbi:MAG: hypothetical protein MUE99_04165 [Chitinophagaceae bacterium]|nr:hypothetical protein [Chitinophagaceae bacterium]
MIEGIPHNDIRNELSKIVDSPLFRQSPKLVKFLNFIVEKTLEGKAHIIKEYTIGKEILDKAGDYDPKFNASVRIHAMRLRKLLADFYQNTEHDIHYRIDLPKGSYQPIFSKAINGSTVGSANNNPESNEKSFNICVVPFTGFVDPETEDISITGFCEFLTIKLSLFQDIRVVPFHSTSQYIETGGTLKNIEKDLDVSNYLTGNIEVEKDFLQVSYQLIDAESQIIIWADQFRTNLQNTTGIDAIDTISSQIVSTLAGYSGLIHYKNILNKNQPPPIQNQMANAIFWFYHYKMRHSSTLFFQAIQKLEKANEIDDNCSICWAILAQLYGDAIIYNYKTEKDPMIMAASCAQKALQLDPHGQHAHLAWAWAQVFYRNKQEVINSLEKMESINPNASYFQAACSFCYALTGDYEKSIEKLNKARGLNPLPYWWLNLGEILFALKTNNYEKMLFHAQKTGTRKVIYEHIFEMICYVFQKNIPAIKLILKEYTAKYPEGLVYLEKVLPAILFDEELGEKIRFALQQLIKMQETLRKEN